MQRRTLVAAAACATAASNALAGVLLVPEQFATIQAAVEAAGDGDTVLIASGTYVENLVISGKGITLAALSSPVVVDGDAADSVVTVQGAPSSVILTGLTIQNGRGDCRGGGVRADDSMIELFGCTIRENTAACVERDGSGFGGGLYAEGLVIMDSCTVESNVASAVGDASGMGGGVFVSGELVILESDFVGNQAIGGFGCSGANGGGIRAATLMAVECRIEGNAAIGQGSCLGSTTASAGGVSAGEGSLIRRCVIAGNVAMGANGLGGGATGGDFDGCLIVDNVASGSYTEGGGLRGSVVVRNSTIAGNTAGMIGDAIFTLGSSSLGR